MDALAIIAKITGALLLVWTGRSIYKHFSQHRRNKNSAAPQGNAPAVDAKKHSVTEHFLNYLLLYLWFIFLLAFSLGLIFNN
jgi:hypothetical protein